MAGEKEKAAAENAAKASAPPVSSENKTPKSLKPKSKIAKKSQNSNLIKVNKFKGTPQVQGKKSKKKKRSVSEGNKESSNSEKGNEKKPSSRDMKQKSIAYEEKNLSLRDLKQKSLAYEEKKLSLRDMKQKSIAYEEHDKKNQQNHETKEKRGGLQKKQNQKNNEKQSGLGKNQLNQMNKEKRVELEKNQQKEKKKDKLGGLIFMCSAKTKPDCFRYRVMGVPMSKKDLVLGVKPGLKIFLYDFDLRLMYGIYKASSSGGVKLEPTAFGGAFPVQVRFNVHQDCYPLPESVFKKAIKENYNERNKFETELTVKQVKRLMQLFRPAEIRSKAPATHPLPMVTIQDREVYEGAEESRPHSYREPFARDHQTYDEVRRYSALSHENDQHLPYREVNLMEKEEFSRDSFLSEKEYRTYGLRRERPNLTPPTSHVAPALEPYPRHHMTEHLPRHPSAIYRDVAPPPGEPSRHDPLFLNEKEYQTYGLAARRELPHPIPSAPTATASTLDSYPKYPYYSSQYVASSVDPYPPHSRREEVPSGSYSLGGSRGTYLTETDDLQRREHYLNETDDLGRRGTYLAETVHLGRRENDDVERLYSTYASSALSDYNQIHKHQGARPEPTFAPVSSRYSFAGPSLSYR